METTIFGSLIGWGLFALAGAVIWVGVQLRGVRIDLRSALRPTLSERINRVAEQTRANELLLSERRGREIFFNYTLSEAAVIAFVEDVERKVQENPTMQIEELRREVANDSRNMFKRGWDWLVEKKGKIAEKVFGKVNDLVKGMIPGFGSNSDGAV